MEQEKNKESTMISKDSIYSKKIAVYFNMASMSPPIELHAAVVRDLLSRDNEVTVYFLNKTFKSSIENPFNRPSIRRFSNFRAHDAVKGLNVKIKNIDLISENTDVPSQVNDSLELGVMSSLASATKAQYKEQLNKRWSKVYDRMLNSAKKLFNYFVNEIEKESYDFIFLFNGRFGCAKPALEAARSSGIGFGLYDVKKTINEVVFVNELVHSIQGNTIKALAAYEANKEKAKEDASKFFAKKVKHENTGDPVFTKDQKFGELPDVVINNINKKVIAVYPTTEDEYKFIGKEWDGYVPESQVDEIEKMVTNLNPDKYLVIVKMHPNQANTAEGTVERYISMSDKYSHVFVEDPFSKKDTYALMHNSDVVVTFASTIGVEACYAGKAVVLIGDTNWSKMNVAYKVNTGVDAAKIIQDGLDPKPIEGAIIWGNYLAVYKDTLPGYKMVSNGDYRVNNKHIGKSNLLRILQLPAKLEIETSKPGFKFNLNFFSRIKSVASNIITGKWSIR